MIKELLRGIELIVFAGITGAIAWVVQPLTFAPVENVLLVRELPADIHTDTNYLWVDAREEKLFRKGHIPGAIHLSETQWERGLESFLMSWSPGQIVIVYCDSEACQSSKAVAERLRDETGIEDIKTLKGGWESWLAAQRPIGR